jgi:opacity protein-like surface antigen
MTKLIFASLLLLSIAGLAIAEDVPKVEIFDGYSIQRLGIRNASSDILPVLGDLSYLGFTSYAESTKYQKYGFNASFTYNLDSIFGIETAFKYNSGDIINIKMQIPIYDAGEDFSYLYPYNVSAKYTNFAVLAGPRFSSRKSKIVTPFAHALMGFDHARSSANYSLMGESSGMDLSKDTGFGLALGGGIDLNVNKHFAVRLIQADYFLTQHTDALSSPKETLNNLSLAFGAVFRLGEKK